MLRRPLLIIVSPNQKRPMPRARFPGPVKSAQRRSWKSCWLPSTAPAEDLRRPDHGCLVPGRPEGHIQGLLMRGKMVYAVHIYQMR